MANGNSEWMLWKFTVGDLIALGAALAGPVLTLGIMSAEVKHNEEGIDRAERERYTLAARVTQLEVTAVPRAEYRQDVAEIKRLLERIEDQLREHAASPSNNGGAHTTRTR